jgi:hypothetical protein
MDNLINSAYLLPVLARLDLSGIVTQKSVFLWYFTNLGLGAAVNHDISNAIAKLSLQIDLIDSQIRSSCRR